MLAKNKIRVAYVIGSLPYGGAENQVQKILSGLNSDHFERFLITFKQFDSESIQLLDPEIKRVNMRLRKKGQIACIFRMYQFFKNFNINVVQAHMYYPNLLSSIAVRLAKVPVFITTEHGIYPPMNAVKHFYERHVISLSANARVCVSKDIGDAKVKFGDIPANKLFIIPNCVDIYPMRLLPKKKKIVIGTLGRLDPVKDYATLLRAFQIVVECGNDSKLVIVGDGPDRKNLEKLAIKLEIADHVDFAGFQKNVQIFLDTFDIFVLSSLSEGIPVSMLEAMAKGIPVVATHVGGIPEVIKNNESGLLVKSRDPTVLAKALITLIQDYSQRKRLGESGRQLVISSYDCKKICKQYETLYTNLLVKQ